MTDDAKAIVERRQDTPEEIEETVAQLFALARAEHSDFTVAEDGAFLIERQAAEIARLKAGGCARDQGLTQFCAEAAKFAAENARLRQIISECATAIGNGSVCKPSASVDFMAHLPAEIRAVVPRTPPSGGWMPIDDEAKDGSLYELLRDNKSVEVGYWHLANTAASRPDLGKRFPWAIVDTTQDTGWNGLMDNHHGPTHYRPMRSAAPLPPSPTDTTTAEG